MHAFDSTLAGRRLAQAWDEDITRQITDYIAIPAKSPAFAADWRELGHIDTVVRNAAAWAEHQQVAGLKLEVVRLPGRTPLIFFEVPAAHSAGTQTALMYGHLDKQPEFEGWRSELGPWTPVIQDDRL